MAKTIVAYPLVILVAAALLVCGVESILIAAAIIALYGLVTVVLPGLYRKPPGIVLHWGGDPRDQTH